MGYRDDFYAVENIIGYSGRVSDFPTVYFQNGDEFGHITQKHGYPQNVGRMEVHADPNYVMENAEYQGGIRLIERIGDRLIHVSRSTFKPIETTTFDDQAVLVQAIRNNPNEKQISTFSEADMDAIDLTMIQKARTMTELTS